MPGPYRGEWFLGALSVPICFPDPIPMTNLIDSATNRAFFFFFLTVIGMDPCVLPRLLLSSCVWDYTPTPIVKNNGLPAPFSFLALISKLMLQLSD